MGIRYLQKLISLSTLLLGIKWQKKGCLGRLLDFFLYMGERKAIDPDMGGKCRCKNWTEMIVFPN
jgi:hypothetical protein